MYVTTVVLGMAALTAFEGLVWWIAFIIFGIMVWKSID
jgi:hypothetical protein